ncbi:cell surface glycoprotein CD200 receptor 2-like isoform X2 [Poeciliopsis prolifica]|uniref:cell surface glycoprotein CD200 receptor 2-like isoform X2 n=1 Tax=Poeciliopsis prolifica TaxID=188132 RepID=UPI002413413F|nr:cell surface glycoprotein CD200 receptor 2-like isoform X2 [Poeciliopsis prolifica]
MRFILCRCTMSDVTTQEVHAVVKRLHLTCRNHYRNNPTKEPKDKKKMHKLWIYVVIFLLSEEWFLTQGTTETPTTSNIIVNTTTSPVKRYVNRKEVFNLGSDSRLICSNTTQTKAIFIIWEIELKHKACKISFSHEGHDGDPCNDGKSIQNSTGLLFLHIPNFSVNDVGTYRCEAAYTGGNENYNISVGVIAPPAVSAWLERRGNKLVAVCRAERGIPAASISWSLTGNYSMKQQNDPDGVVTVESQLEVPEDIDPENLTCIVRHQFWAREKTFTPRFGGQRSVSMLWIRVAVVFIVIILGLLIFVLRKRRCQQ